MSSSTASPSRIRALRHVAVALSVALSMLAAAAIGTSFLPGGGDERQAIAYMASYACVAVPGVAAALYLLSGGSHRERLDRLAIFTLGFMFELLVLVCCAAAHFWVSGLAMASLVLGASGLGQVIFAWRIPRLLLPPHLLNRVQG